MNELSLLLPRHAAQVVLNGLWQGTLIVAAVALGLRVLPRLSAAHRFAVWAVTFALALTLPLLSVAASSTHPEASSTLHVPTGWGMALTFLWIATFAVRGVRLAMQAWRVRTIWLAAEPLLADPQTHAVLNACPRHPRLCTSTLVDAPSVIGFLSPRLLIPVSMLHDLTPAELNHIVLHECEHLRRRDDWLNLLQKLALTVFPLNPALLWVDRRLGLERELACDAGVVAATGAPLDYATCLTRLAEHRLGRGRFALALSAWARRSELARRIYTLLQPIRGLSRPGTQAALTAIACILILSADGIVQAPSFVSFAPVAEPVVAINLPPAALSRATAAVFRTSGARPRATLVSAVAPVAAHHPLRPRAARRVRTQKGTMAPRWIEAAVPHAIAPAYATPVKFSYTYAAVPFGDGWLIVQL